MVKKKTFSKKRIKPKKKVKKVVRKRTESPEGTYQPKIGVIGIGGGGGSIVGEIAKSISKKNVPHAGRPACNAMRSIAGRPACNAMPARIAAQSAAGGRSIAGRIKFVVANVDYQAIKAAPKQTGVFYFGQNITHGLGCGMNTRLGEEAALEDKKGIEKLLKKCDFCILIACLGGGTGSGATPVFADTAKNLGILTLGIFTLPFKFEGSERARIARTSLEKIKPHLNAYVIMPNQRIFKIIDEKTPIHKSLAAMNNILVKTLEGFIETLYLPGLINLDFSDFRAILDKESSLTYLHSQEFAGLNRAEKAVEAVLKNPLISYDISGVERMLFNIAGAKDMRMSEVERVSKRISDFNPQAKIIFGVLEDSHHKNKFKITLLAVGCKDKSKSKKQKAKIRRKRVKAEIESQKGAIAEKKEEIKPETKPETTKEEVKKPRVKEIEEKKLIIKKKRALKKKPQAVKKTMVRRNALDLHKQVEEDEKKMLEEESKWDIPAFLRGENNK